MDIHAVGNQIRVISFTGAHDYARSAVASWTFNYLKETRIIQMDEQSNTR